MRRRSSGRFFFRGTLLAGALIALAGCERGGPPVTEVISTANRKLDAGQADQAILLLENLNRDLNRDGGRDHPDQPEVYEALAEAYSHQGEHIEAAFAFLQLASLRPRDLQWRLFAAKSLERAGDFKGAIRETGRYLGARPHDAAVWRSIGELHARINEPGPAIEALLKSFNLRERAPLAVHLGDLYRGLQNSAQATAWYGRALALNDPAASADALLGLLRVNVAKRDFDAAEKVIARLDAEHPGHLDASPLAFRRGELRIWREKQDALERELAASVIDAPGAGARPEGDAPTPGQPPDRGEETPAALAAGAVAGAGAAAVPGDVPGRPAGFGSPAPTPTPTSTPTPTPATPPPPDATLTASASPGTWVAIEVAATGASGRPTPPAAPATASAPPARDEAGPAVEALEVGVTSTSRPTGQAPHPTAVEALEVGVTSTAGGEGIDPFEDLGKDILLSDGAEGEGTPGAEAAGTGETTTRSATGPGEDSATGAGSTVPAAPGGDFVEIQVAGIDPAPPRPPDDYALFDQARRLRDGGRFDEAVKVLWTLINRDDSHADLWSELSETLLLGKNYAMADATALQAIHLDPDNVRHTLTFLQAARAHRSPDRYFYELQKARLKFPKDPEITLTLARSYAQFKRNYRNAAILYRDFLRNSPHHSKAGVARAELSRLPNVGEPGEPG